MSVCSLYRTLLVLLVGFGSLSTGVAFADTYMVLANNTNGVIYKNGSDPLQHERAMWSGINNNFYVPDGGYYYKFTDTGKPCDGNGYLILADIHSDNDQWQSVAGSYCIKLGFMEIGCLAARIDSNRSVHFLKADGLVCSNKWWNQNNGWAAFGAIMSMFGAIF